MIIITVGLIKKQYNGVGKIIGLYKGGGEHYQQIIYYIALIHNHYINWLFACPQSNIREDSKQPLTKTQVDEIITAATESVIVDIDFFQITKPNPVQQTKMNGRMLCLGEKLKDKVTAENKNIVVARVNGEPVTASDWYLEKANKSYRRNITIRVFLPIRKCL